MVSFCFVSAVLAVTCPSLSTPLHGISHPNDCQGSTYDMGCWFSCDSGYHLQGQGLLTCQEDGTWSDLLPNCEGINITYLHMHVSNMIFENILAN